MQLERNPSEILGDFAFEAEHAKAGCCDEETRNKPFREKLLQLVT